MFDLERPVPFAVGIHRQLAAAFPDMPKRTLKGLLGWLTCRRAYLIACTAGAPRYGLQGQEGRVTERQAEHAKRLFAARDERARDKWIDRVAA
jgi:ProP effector